MVGGGDGDVVVVDGTVVVVDGSVVLVVGSAVSDAANAGDAMRRNAARVAVISDAHRWRTELDRRTGVRFLTEPRDP